MAISNTGFTFPPPPPPPPKRDNIPETPRGPSGQGSKGGAYGRGNGWSGGDRGRGRGFSRGAPRGNQFLGSRGGGRGQISNNRATATSGFVGHREWSQSYSSRGNPTLGAPPGHNELSSSQSQRSITSNNTTQFNVSQKRDHSTAFRGQRGRGPKPSAAPAVPSFLSNIPGLSPPTPSASSAGIARSPTEKKPKPRTTNILGLNPSTQHPDSASDDEDEEAKLAPTATANSHTGLTYEYRGQTATLRTPAEIAAWIAERRKRYPTAAKAEQAKREAEEKKANLEARQLQREAYEEEKAKSMRKVENWLGKDKKMEGQAERQARLKTEKLLKKAAKAQKQLAKAQHALKRVQGTTASVTAGAKNSDNGEEGAADIMDSSAQHDTAPPGVQDDSDASSVVSEMDSEDEDTSSSGTSSGGSSEESDAASNSAPESRSTKRTAPDRVPPPPRLTPVTNHTSDNVCRSMLKTGQCKHGKKCRYSHELPEGHQVAKKAKVEVSAVTGRPKRKRLWEVMVEKEQEEERKQVLKVIVELGNEGLLEP